MVKFLKRVKGFEILSKSPAQTKKLGKTLAQEILKTETKRALVLGLIGDLGGGKTTFLKGFAKGLGIKEKILSPTFVILKRFKIGDRKMSVKSHKTTLRARPLTFYHIDCYRIEKPKEILNLGFKEIISNPQNIVTIEWADRIKKFLPKETLILNFEFVGKDSRKISLFDFK